MSKNYYVYIVTSQKNGTLYTGITSDIARRTWEHREKIINGFSSKYNTKRLVYVETYNDVAEAIKREKNIKAWKRAWKIEAIEKQNPEWNDLYKTII